MTMGSMDEGPLAPPRSGKPPPPAVTIGVQRHSCPEFATMPFLSYCWM
jgi:hypothetical protein